MPSNLTAEDAERYAKSNARARIVEFGGSGHMIFDDEPGPLFAAITEFLAAI